MGDDVDDLGLEVARVPAEGRVVLALRGQLDVASAEVLVDAVEACRPLTDPLTLDVSELGFVDSSGLRSLVTVRLAALEDTDRDVALVGATDMLRKLLAMSGLDTAFSLSG